MKVNSPKKIPRLFSRLHTYATTLKLLRELDVIVWVSVALSGTVVDSKLTF